VKIVIKVEKKAACMLREGDSVIVHPSALATVTAIKKIIGFRSLKTEKARVGLDRIAVFDDNTARVIPGDEVLIALVPGTEL
jgi:translation initiation factor IF-1